MRPYMQDLRIDRTNEREFIVVQRRNLNELTSVRLKQDICFLSTPQNASVTRFF